MFKKKKNISIFVVMVFIINLITPVQVVFAANKTVTINKTVNPSTITSIEEAEITLSIKGSPPVNVVMPNDVILIIDKSGSMSGQKIVDAKESAKGFIDLMDLTKHRVGIVDYSSESYLSPLGADAEVAKKYIDTISANGGTNTGQAIRTAIKELGNHREDAQPVIVILTDGAANSFEDAKAAALEAKDAGIVFYTIALLNTGDNPDSSAPNLLLKEMATTAHHHHFVLGSTGLAEIYAAILKEIGIASAYDVVVKDVVAPQFEIVPGSYDQNIPKPIVNGNELTWEFLELKDQTLTFSYKIRPKNQDTVGNFPVTDGGNIVYKNYTGSTIKDYISTPYLRVNYPAPEITAITPDNGDVNGGNEVSIIGNYFRDGAEVTFNSVNATDVQVVSPTEIKAKVPTGQQGNAVVKVFNDDYQYGTSTYRYWATPWVTSVSPNKGLVSGNTRVVIDGKYFMPGIKVYFGDKEAKVEYRTAQQIYAYSPSVEQPQVVNIVITNPDETIIIVNDGFTYENEPSPEITSVEANEGELDGGEYIYIYGDNFKEGASIQVGENDVSKIVFVEKNRIRVQVPAGSAPGTVDVTVTNSDGQSAVLNDGYTYRQPPQDPAPVIDSISPAEGEMVGGEYIYIYGSNFKDGAIVQIGGQDPMKVVFVEANRIRIQVPGSAVSGKVDITVTNPDGQSTVSTDGYTYKAAPLPPAPVITSITPKEGELAGGEYVYIYGENFQNNLSIKIGGQDPMQIVFVESNRIRIQIPASSVSGKVDIEVINPDGQSAVLTGAYTYIAPKPILPPTINSLSQTEGELVGGAYVFVFGTDFQPGIKVYFGSVEATVTNEYGSDQIRVLVPAVVSEGIVDVTATNPDGQSVTLVGAYTYLAPPPIPAPTITSLSNTLGSIKGGELVFIEGTGFQQGVSVKLGGIDAKVTNFYGDTRFRIQIPAVTTEGLVDLQLTNPDGQSTALTDAYEYFIPSITITSISKTNSELVGGSYISVYGTNFDSDVVVTVNGTPVDIYYYRSDYIRIKSMPAGTDIGLTVAGGVVPIVLTNPSSGKSASIDFTYNPKPAAPVPVIDRAVGAGGSVAEGPVTGGGYLYFYGTGLSENMKVRIYDGGNNIVNETVIKYFYRADYSRHLMPAVIAPGIYSITLVNEEGIESNAVQYVYK